MSTVRDRLAAIGFELPGPAAALGDYVAAVRHGDLVFTSGQLPLVEGELMATGPVGEAVSVERAQECAARAALNALAAASGVCDLDEVARVVKLVGYVACVPDFTQQPAVINGASAIMAVAFGDAGRHAREAVGVAALPLGSPVEVSIILGMA
jgi:enamine deaminase RidA (YjgF/YER057c/UK114 family)